MALSEGQRIRVRHHLGYLNVSTAATFVLGTPAGVQTQFIIEKAMDELPVAAEPKALEILDRLDSLDFQIFDDASTLVASRVGEIDLNPDEFEKLLQRYNFVRNGLANLLGCYCNPYDKRFYGDGGAGSINATVVH